MTYDQWKSTPDWERLGYLDDDEDWAWEADLMERLEAHARAPEPEDFDGYQ